MREIVVHSFLKENKSIGVHNCDFSQPDLLKEELAREWKEKYNVDVVPISNFSTLQLKSLIKDISKFYNIPYMEVNVVTGAMMQEATSAAKQKHGIKSGVYVPTFEEVLEFSPTLQKYLKKYTKIAEHVNNLKGAVRGTSQHAAGVVFGEKLSERMPLIRSAGTIQTPWAEGQAIRNLEPMGFLKMDILGLVTLKIIYGTIERILQQSLGVKPTVRDVWGYYNQFLHPDKIDFNNQEIYDHIFANKQQLGLGVFQFSTEGAQNFCISAKPKKLEDISAITAIYRPGPLGVGVDEKFLAVRNNELHIQHKHKLIDDVLAETNGVLVYQEQLASMAHVLGKNISLTEGNQLRKLLIKKGLRKIEEKKEKIKGKFTEGCLGKGLNQRDVDKMWEEFESHAKYSFNFSHSLAYSVISFQCAYLLHYYPSEWCAALLDNESEERKELATNLIHGAGLSISPLSINSSGTRWEVSPNKKMLVPPLTSIKGLGDKALEQIINHRPFINVEEFLFHPDVVYSKLNKKAIDVLVRGQALNELVDERFTGLKHFWSAVAVDRPRTPKDLLENIEKYKAEGNFTNEEKVDYIVGLTGAFPYHLVLTPAIEEGLKKHCIPSVSEFDQNLEFAWFIPREVIVRYTKNNKPYWIVKTIDTTGATQQIKFWGIREKDKLYINRVYAAKLKYDEKWGYSAAHMGNVKLLG